MPSQLNRSLGRGKRKGLTHREVMQKRHEKRRKKEKRDLKHKKMDLLKEYKRLCKIDTMSKKDTAMQVMEIIEEIKEEGMNDQRYLQIMDMLMNLHKEEENAHETSYYRRTTRNLYETNFRDFYFDRVGDNRNIINETRNIIDRFNRDISEANDFGEENVIINDININVRENAVNDIIIDNTVIDGWERIGQGSWRRTEQQNTPGNQVDNTTSTPDDY